MKKDLDRTQRYDEVKMHYEQAAENRNQRLRTPHFNAAKVNHRDRSQIIKAFLREIGHAQNAIDIGTGTGVWAEVLIDYCANVIGIDFAHKNIMIARDNAKQQSLSNRLTYILGDAEKLEEVNSNSFDIVTHISVLQHLPNREQALRRVNEILRETGHLIILVHNKHCIYNRNARNQRKRGKDIAINEFQTLREMKKLLAETGFKIQGVRLCWLVILDLLMIGSGKAILKPFMPIRKVLLAICSGAGRLLGRLQSLNPFFCEIVILAKKETK